MNALTPSSVAARAAATLPLGPASDPASAILAESAGGSLVLNELADTRAALLSSLFPALAVTRFDAAQVHDHLDPATLPSAVLMNPPFSAMAHVVGRVQDAGFRHIASALARLAPGGRLVAITGANVGPDMPDWRDAFARLQERGRVVFSAAIAGAVYAKHGTTFPTRLTVIDKAPADDPAVFPASPGLAPDVATLLGWIEAQVPPRLAVSLPTIPVRATSAPRGVDAYLRTRTVAAAPVRSRPSTLDIEGVELAYETLDWTPPDGVRLTDAIYEEYGLQSIRIPGARPHPTRLVQSAAMASIAGRSGQTVCRTGHTITVDGVAFGDALERDRRGRPLPVWQGCRRIAADQLFLMNVGVPDSLDGRYFGPLPASTVIGRATPLWTDEDGSGRFVWHAPTR